MIKSILSILCGCFLVIGYPAIAGSETYSDSLALHWEKMAFEGGAGSGMRLCQVFHLQLEHYPAVAGSWVASMKSRSNDHSFSKLKPWLMAFDGVLKVRSGETREGLHMLQAVEKDAAAAGDHQLKGYVVINMGLVHAWWGDHQQASELIRNGARIASRQPVFFRFLAGMAKINFFSLWNQNDSAAMELEKLMRISRHPDVDFFRPALTQSAISLDMRRSDLQAASKGLDSLLSNLDPRSATYAQGTLTKIIWSYRVGNFLPMTNAVSDMLKADGSLSMQGHFDRAQFYLYLAEGYDYQGKYDLATKFVTMALEMADHGNYIGLQGRCHLERAWISFALKDLAGSGKILQLADDLFKRAKDPWSLTNSLNLKAVVAEFKGDYQTAFEYHVDCLKRRLLLDDPSLLSATIYNMGSIRVKTGHFSEALSLLRQSLAIDASRGDVYGVSIHYSKMAGIQKSMGQLDSARWYLKKAVNLGESFDMPMVLKGCYLDLSEIEDARGMQGSSAAYLRKYIRIQDELLADEANLSASSYQALFDLAGKERELEKVNVDLALQRQVLKEQRRTIFFILAAGALAVIAAVVLLRVSRKMRKLSRVNAERAELLDEKNKEIELAMVNLRKAQDQIVNAEKMAALGVMSFGVAHELNNPLNYIRGGFLALRKELSKPNPDQAKLDKLLNAIDDGVSRSARIVQGMTQYSHTSESMEESCDVHQILDNCLIILESKLKGRIKVDRDYFQGLIELKGNSGRLHQALLNLLSNAEQSIAGEGEISIHTTLITGQDAVIEIGDTGCGIPKENIKRLGDLFFTTKPPGEGTGFGLSMCYQVVREMGGRVEVESTIGKGTCFRLIFPANR